MIVVLLKKFLTCLKCIKFGILDGNLIKPVHEASYVSQPFLARRYVSQPFLTRRQEVQTCQSIFSDKKNSLVARKFQEYISLNQARYVVQLQKMKTKMVARKLIVFLIR